MEFHLTVEPELTLALMTFQLGLATTILDGCSLTEKGTTAQTGAITFGAARTTNILKNTTVSFGNVGDTIIVNGQFTWRNTNSAIQGATIPTTLLEPATYSGIAIIRSSRPFCVSFRK